jgi:hypothetical protein
MAPFPCINVFKLSEDEKSRILAEFQRLKGMNLPTLYEQLKCQTLRELDLAIMKALRIEQAEKVLEQLYTDLVLELDRTEGTDENPEL